MVQWSNYATMIRCSQLNTAIFMMERTHVPGGPCCKKKYCGRQCGNVEKLFRQLLCVSFLSLVAVSSRKNLFWEDLVAKPKWSGFWIYFKEGHPRNLICHRSWEEEEEHCKLSNLGSRILLHHIECFCAPAFNWLCLCERLLASVGREAMSCGSVDWKFHFSQDK